MKESITTNTSNLSTGSKNGVGDEWEVDPKEVIFGEEIGQGAYGKVNCGWWKNKLVAVKVLKETIPSLYREDLLREITLLKGLGNHPNIVSFLGASTMAPPIALIMEYVPFGDLHVFLKKCKNNINWKGGSKELISIHCMVDNMSKTEEVWHVTSKDLVSWGRQVALAMEYLSKKKYIHRDLAARNVLLSNNKTIKLCDFGLARLILKEKNHYYRRTNAKLPIKWMSIESIKDRIYTSKSDVWAFGVLIWEIVTFGSTPYESIPIGELFNYLVAGYRMSQPFNCSDELYNLMMNCWKTNPDDRPSFFQLRNYLEEMLSKEANYLELDLNTPTPASPNLQKAPGPPNLAPSSSMKSSGFLNNSIGSFKSILKSETLPRLVKSKEMKIGEMAGNLGSKMVKNICYSSYFYNIEHNNNNNYKFNNKDDNNININNNNYDINNNINKNYNEDEKKQKFLIKNHHEKTIDRGKEREGEREKERERVREREREREKERERERQREREREREKERGKGKEKERENENDEQLEEFWDFE